MIAMSINTTEILAEFAVAEPDNLITEPLIAAIVGVLAASSPEAKVRLLKDVINRLSGYGNSTLLVSKNL